MKKISISLIFLISFFGLRPCSIFSAPSNIQEVYEIKLNKKEKRLIKVFSDQAINKSVKKAEKNKFDPFFIIDPLGKIFIAPLVKVAKISRVIPIPRELKEKLVMTKIT